MRVVPVRYTSDPLAMRRFLEALGLTASIASDSGGWIELQGTGGGVGVHVAALGDARTTDLSFESDELLERVAERLSAAGFESAIIDESFGRSLRVLDPEGVEVQVNEAMCDLYGYTDLFTA